MDTDDDETVDDSGLVGSWSWPFSTSPEFFSLVLAIWNFSSIAGSYFPIFRSNLVSERSETVLFPRKREIGSIFHSGKESFRLLSPF